MRFSQLFSVGILIVTATLVSSAQLTVEDRVSARLIPGCHRAWIDSRSSALPARLISDKLQMRGEFIDAGLSLSSSQDQADVTVSVSGDAHDATIFVVRSSDGNTASSKVAALGEYPGIVAAKIVDTLHELCPSVSTSDRWFRGRLLLPKAAAIQIASAKSLAVVSQTSAIDEIQLARTLRDRHEIRSWGLVIDSRNERDDLKLEISRDLQRPIVWRYEIFNNSGDSLLIGSIAAFGEQHAAEKITNRVLQQFAHYRPETIHRSNSQNDMKSGAADDDRVYRVKLVTDDPSTTGTPLWLTLTEGKLLARNSLGQAVLHIGAPDLEDVAVSNIRGPVLEGTEEFGDWIEENAYSILGRVEPHLILAYMGLAAISYPLAPRAHLIDVAWDDGESYRSTTLQVEGRDVGSIMRNLRGLQHSAVSR